MTPHNHQVPPSPDSFLLAVPLHNAPWEPPPRPPASPSILGAATSRHYPESSSSVPRQLILTTPVKKSIDELSACRLKFGARIDNRSCHINLHGRGVLACLLAACVLFQYIFFLPFNLTLIQLPSNSFILSFAVYLIITGRESPCVTPRHCMTPTRGRGCGRRCTAGEGWSRRTSTSWAGTKGRRRWRPSRTFRCTPRGGAWGCLPSARVREADRQPRISPRAGNDALMSAFHVRLNSRSPKTDRRGGRHGEIPGAVP